MEPNTVPVATPDAVPEQPTVSVDPTIAPPINITPTVADERANKARPAINAAGFTPPHEEVVRAIMEGREQKLRDQVAKELDYRKESIKQEAILEAAKQNGPLAPDQVKHITDTVRSMIDPTDPTSVFEEYYSMDYLKYLKDTGDVYATDMKEARRTIPEYVNRVEAFTSDGIAKQQYAQTLYQNASQIASEQTTTGFVLDWGKAFFTGGLYTEAKLRGIVEDVSRFYGLRGTNVEAQIDALYQLPFPEFKEKLKAIHGKLTEDNPALALDFMKAVIGRSTDDVRLENAYSILDLSTIPSLLGLGKNIAKNAYLAQKTNEAFKDALKSTAKPDPTGAVAQEAAGDLAGAAVTKTTNDFISVMKSGANPTREAAEALPSYMRASAARLGEAAEATDAPLVRDLNLKMKDVYERTIGRIVSAIENSIKVERIGAVLASEQQMTKVMNYVKELHTGLSGNILDIRYIGRNAITNGHDLEIYIGKPGSQLFFNEQQAKAFAKESGLVDFNIVKRNTGDGRAITIIQSIPENASVVRDGLFSAPNAVSPTSKVDDFLGGYLGWGRTPEDTLSLEHRMNRKAATYAVSNIMRLVKEESQYIRDLVKGVVRHDPVTGEELQRPYKLSWLTGERTKRFEDWERVIKAARKKLDDDGKEGYFFKDTQDLQDFYLQHIGRMADSVEVQAYFAFKRMNEIDAIFRDLAVHRNMARLGAKQYAFSALHDNGERLESPFFNGIKMNYFPGGDDSILIALGKYGDERLERLGTPGLQKKYEKGVSEGKYQVIRIFDPEARPLSAWGKAADARIRYVLTDKVEMKNLDWNPIPRRGGGHFEYDYDFYIKQANIRPEYNTINKRFHTWYEGDNTVMPVGVRGMGKDIAKKLDEVRLLLKAKKEEEAQAVANGLGVGWDELHSWFKPSHGPGGEYIPPRLSMDEPFYVVKKGQSIIDTYADEIEKRYAGRNFKNGLKEGSDARQYQVQFTGERDAYDMITLRKGSVDNPIYSVEPAKMIDPIPSMDRAISRIAHSLFLDDYKNYAIEHWIEEARHFMKKPDEVRDAPLWHFHNPDWKPGIEQATINRLEFNKQKIDQLLGVPSKWQSFLHTKTQELADSVFEGSNLAIIPHWLLSKTGNDPWGTIRSVVMNVHLGFYAIPQVMVQAQTYANIYAIAGGRYANAGTYGAYLTLMSRVNKNPKYLEALDKLASSGVQVPGVSHWKPGQFLESLREMDNSGYSFVGGEHALSDILLSPKMIQSAGKQFLDAGLMFFRAGEKSVRWGSWHTAYREFRDANPIKAITNADRLAILERADLLNANMSRASSSQLHSGILSLPSQFLSYQMRVAEQFFGKRLGETTADRNRIRARMIGYYSALYGAPTALGVTGLPIGDFIRKSALENGYVVGDQWLESLIMEGLPSTAIAFVNGGGDISKGRYYNIGDRLGIKGLDQIKEILRGDAKFLNMMFGAAGSTFADTLSFADPFHQYMLSLFRGNDKNYPLTIADAADIIKILSEGNNIHKSIGIINTGKLFSRKGANLDSGLSVWEAIGMHLTGVQPQSVTDLNLLAWSRKDQLEVEKKAMDLATKEFRKGLDTRDSPNDAARYFTRAFTALRVAGVDYAKFGTMISRATQGSESLVNQMDWQYYVKNATSDMRRKLEDAYRRKSIIKDKQRGSIQP